MSCNRFTTDDYAFYAMGTLEGPARDHLRSHLRVNCADCTAEIKDSLELCYVLAALTETTQAQRFQEPSAILRERVLAIPGAAHPNFGRNWPVRNWMRIAAGILVVVGVGTTSWRAGQIRSKRDIDASRIEMQKQTAALKKLESENDSLRNLVTAARNAPAVFPGKAGIVSVQDPYMVRDLQQARQTQVAIAEALDQERARAADLEKRLGQTTGLLAAATRDKENADLQYRKAFDAATMEKERGVNRLSTEISAYRSKLQDLETENTRQQTALDSQNKELAQHLRMLTLLQSGDVTLVHLRATEPGRKAFGVALLADNSHLLFFPTNLPSAPAGRTYQLWLLGDKDSAVSAGTFSSIAKGTPSLQFGNSLALPAIKGIALTEEPAGGSRIPTGHKLMVGSIKAN